jgi:hypothetical protein
MLLYHTYMVSNIVGSPHGTGCGETRGLAQWNSCADTEYERVLGILSYPTPFNYRYPGGVPSVLFTGDRGV